MARLVVVGGGIVGLAVARQLLRTDPTASVVVIEREEAVGIHQTGHNSGVIHSGLYYQPGSLKAELCVAGGKLMKSFCAEHSIPVEPCGKVVVAVDDCELERLQALFERGLENGVPELRIVEGAALRDIEPHVAGLRAIHSPTTCVVDYSKVARALTAEVLVSGQLWLGTEVISVLPRDNGLVRLELVGSHVGHFDCDFAIVCAGLQSDRVAARSGTDAEPRIVPFRGSYYRLRASSKHLVRGLVYPVPDPRYPFLGIHLTKTVQGDVLVGPNAFVGFTRDDYARGAFDWRDVRETLQWPGFARFAGSNWRAGARELAHAVSRRGFASAVRRYLPELAADDLEPAVAGIRAQAMRRDGSLVDDFWLEARDGILDVRNAPSPAATASLAIAEHICDRAGLS
jgi:L-2-hydroxyglutarate oxidase LhgO